VQAVRDERRVGLVFPFAVLFERIACGARREPWEPCVGGFVFVFTTMVALVLAASSTV
jgi:hypothetical protein